MIVECTGIYMISTQGELVVVTNIILSYSVSFDWCIGWWIGWCMNDIDRQHRSKNIAMVPGWHQRFPFVISSLIKIEIHPY